MPVPPVTVLPTVADPSKLLAPAVAVIVTIAVAALKSNVSPPATEPLTVTSVGKMPEVKVTEPLVRPDASKVVIAVLAAVRSTPVVSELAKPS